MPDSKEPKGAGRLGLIPGPLLLVLRKLVNLSEPQLLVLFIWLISSYFIDLLGDS